MTVRMNILPTQTFLLECFDYNQETGTLTWKIRPLHHFDGSVRYQKSWNTRWSGKLAGAIDSKGYYVILIEKKMQRAHRLIWKLMTGEDSKLEIDHIDNNPKNNAWVNLREATRVENCRNVRKHKNNSTGYKGVSFDKLTGKFKASIYIGSSNKNLGYYLTPEMAYRAYCEASKKYHKEFSNLG
jgi:hypothetical protein